MATTEKQRIAKSYVAGAVALLEELQGPYGADLRPNDLAPPMKLLDCAAGLVDGKDEKREKKNAGDRARRAKPKPKTRRRAKAPTPSAYKSARDAALGID